MVRNFKKKYIYPILWRMRKQTIALESKVADAETLLDMKEQFIKDQAVADRKSDTLLSHKLAGKIELIDEIVVYEE